MAIEFQPIKFEGNFDLVIKQSTKVEGESFISIKVPTELLSYITYVNSKVLFTDFSNKISEDIVNYLLSPKKSEE